MKSFYVRNDWNLRHTMRRIMVIIVGILVIGFISVFVLTNPLFSKTTPDTHVIPADKEVLIEHVQRLTGISPSRNSYNLEALNKSASYIFEEFKKSGYTPEEQKFIAGGKEYKNIICRYGPSGGEKLVIGAHYDVCGNQAGADDNASGVAGLLEIARLLNSLKPDLKYQIELVAYTLEEPPYFRTQFMGSAIHAKSLKDTKAQVKAMISLEMIGYFSDKPKSQEFPIGVLKLFYPTTGNFIAIVGKLGQGGIVRKLKRQMRKGSKIKVVSINAPASIPGIDFSDHLNYWAQDFNAVMITNTSFYRNHNYHQETDTIETLDFDKMNEVVKGVYWAVVNYN